MEVNNQQPLLSICIPTYNRAKILDYVLSQYVSNQEFNDDVEIVISDNASTDDTEFVCKKYQKMHKNIIYNRNERNIVDGNFPLVLNLARGKYIKLLNDWIYLDDRQLHTMKETILENLAKHSPIFFTNDWIDTSYCHQPVVRCNNLDDYVKVVSTYVTSNNFFGAWKDQWEKISDKFANVDKKLAQVGWTYELVNQNKGCIIYNKPLFSISKVPLKRRSGYNWFKVHLDYYYQIMEPYIIKGIVSQDTYKKDKVHLLKHFAHEFCLVYLWNNDKYWGFDTKGTTRLLWKYYRNIPYAYWFFLTLPKYVLLDLARKIKHKIIHK